MSEERLIHQVAIDVQIDACATELTCTYAIELTGTHRVDSEHRTEIKMFL